MESIQYFWVSLIIKKPSQPVDDMQISKEE
jgi:hypothetical protein